MLDKTKLNRGFAAIVKNNIFEVKVIYVIAKLPLD
jgi:hypothetical protein